MKFCAIYVKPEVDMGRIESSGDIERVEFEAEDAVAARVACAVSNLKYVGPVIGDHGKANGHGN